MRKTSPKRVVTSIVFAMILVLSMAFAAFADGAATTQKISVANAKAGSEYSVYQVMTAEIAGQDNDGNNLYTYTVTDAFKAFFKDGANGYTLNDQNEILKDGVVLTGDNRWTNTNSSDAAALASALEKFAIASDTIQTAAVLTKDKPSADLPFGYYVVAETKSSESASGDDSGAKEIATKPILVNLTDTAAEITLKDDTTKLDKVIKERDSELKSNDVNIGDDVDYQITTKIPTYEANVDQDKLMFKLTDTFDVSLDYNGDLTIAGFTAGTDYNASYDEDTHVLTIEFTKEAIFENQGAAVVATYSAKLNEKAKVDSTEGNVNDVKLEYTNNTNEEESHKTLKDETKTYTYGFNVHKVDKVAPSVGLADAKFELKDEDGNKVVFRKDGDTYVVDKTAKEGDEGTTTEIVSVGGEGLATVKGLDAGKYTLTETQAPDKYTKLASDVVVEITASKDDKGNETGKAILTANGAGNAKATGGAEVVDDQGNKTGSVESDGSTININVYVENAKGISLPETGSKTAMYCMIGGAALIIIGGLYYVIGSRKKRA